MAEMPITDPDQLEKLTQKWKQHHEELARAQREYERLLRDKGKYNEATVKQQRALEELKNELEQVEQKLGSQHTAVLKAEQAAKTYQNQIDKLKNATKGLGIISAGWTDNLVNLGATLTAVGLSAVALQSKFVQGVVNPLGSTKDIVAGMPDAFQAANTILRGQAELLNLSGRAHIGLGNSMKEAKASAVDMRRAIGTLQRQYNISAEVSNKYIQVTSHLEGMLGKVNRTVMVGGRPMLHMAAVMTAASAAGVKLENVGDKVSKMMASMGARADDVAVDFAAFVMAAKSSGLSVEFAREQILKATEPLTVFRRTASEAKDVWTVFAKTLKSELAPEQIGSIVQSLTRGMASMNFQTRAFISQMSGAMRGVSALGGALRMEMNLRQEGGLARNLRMAMQAMRRTTGGDPVTLQEAIRNPSQEMRFQLQRQFVGQTLGVQGEQQQARVLEVMQAIQRGTMTNMQASEELADITKTGEDLQRASTTAVEKIANLATRRNDILDTIQHTLSPLQGALDRIQTERFGQRERPSYQEARGAGLVMRRGVEQTTQRARSGLSRLLERAIDPMAGFVSGFARSRRAPEMGPPVNPYTIRQSIRAERRPAVGEDTEMLLQQRPRMERDMPTGAYPYVPERRRTELPAALPTPPIAPAQTRALERGTERGALGEAPEAAAERRPLNITLSVVCDKCQEQLLKKNLNELEERRDQYNLGIETGRYAT